MTTRFLELQEYVKAPTVPLTEDELAALQSVAGSLSVTPTSGSVGCYDVTPGSEVGVINLGSLKVEIRPKIPIPRLLFLISYSIDPIRYQPATFDFEERASLLEAIIHVFVQQVGLAFRRGILQGYRTEEEALSTVRGRVQFTEQIRNHYGRFPPVEVQYDDFTEDIVENRLIKAAINRLRRLRTRSPRSQQLLQRLNATLERVQSVEFDPHALPEIHYTRLNEHYRPAVELARLVLRSTSFEVTHGDVRASAFLIDMNRVFEDFVAIALREALHLTPRTFPQGAKHRHLWLDRTRRISLQPDISWWQDGHCVFAGDVKYKRLTPAGHHNADIYQLLAYTIASDLPGGLLIYAKGEADANTYDIVHADRRLEVVSLDLDQPPARILEQIDEFAGKVRELKRRATAPARRFG